MIDQLGNEAVALHARIVDIDLAVREDLLELRAWRDKVANTYADQIAAIKSDAAAHDVDFAKAIARREAMLGESQSFKMAAE